MSHRFLKRIDQRSAQRGVASQPGSMASGRTPLDETGARRDYSDELSKGWSEQGRLAVVSEATEFVEFRPMTGKFFQIGEDPLVVVGGGNLLLRYPKSGVYLAQSDGGTVEEEYVRRTVSMIRSDAAGSGTIAEVVDLRDGTFGILAITAHLVGVEFGLDDVYATVLVEEASDGSGMCLALELAKAAVREHGGRSRRLRQPRNLQPQRDSNPRRYRERVVS